ncbi:hypothetical protein BV22DRAFT_1044431 [Leucogyrophana mollusca]|uniref:Uncharacterized protein n=1 Tax=Leucogyrophana mollusca TaxID=85980 RepID=A0ACB8BU27_9AGAM|nr:hypothetical protein BV22DRAFT_1044431 [Leucogyrophana mollusca]
MMVVGLFLRGGHISRAGFGGGLIPAGTFNQVATVVTEHLLKQIAQGYTYPGPSRTPDVDFGLNGARLGHNYKMMQVPAYNKFLGTSVEGDTTPNHQIRRRVPCPFGLDLRCATLWRSASDWRPKRALLYDGPSSPHRTMPPRESKTSVKACKVQSDGPTQMNPYPAPIFASAGPDIFNLSLVPSPSTLLAATSRPVNVAPMAVTQVPKKQNPSPFAVFKPQTPAKAAASSDVEMERSIPSSPFDIFKPHKSRPPPLALAPAPAVANLQLIAPDRARSTSANSDSTIDESSIESLYSIGCNFNPSAAKSSFFRPDQAPSFIRPSLDKPITPADVECFADDMRQFDLKGTFVLDPLSGNIRYIAPGMDVDTEREAAYKERDVLAGQIGEEQLEKLLRSGNERLINEAKEMIERKKARAENMVSEDMFGEETDTEEEEDDSDTDLSYLMDCDSDSDMESEPVSHPSPALEVNGTSPASDANSPTPEANDTPSQGDCGLRLGPRGMLIPADRYDETIAALKAENVLPAWNPRARRQHQWFFKPSPSQPRS